MSMFKNSRRSQKKIDIRSSLLLRNSKGDWMGQLKGS